MVEHLGDPGNPVPATDLAGDLGGRIVELSDIVRLIPTTEKE